MVFPSKSANDTAKSGMRTSTTVLGKSENYGTQWAASRGRGRSPSRSPSELPKTAANGSADRSQKINITKKPILIVLKWIDLWVRYRDATIARSLDSRMLADLGLSKQDVVDALKNPEWSNRGVCIGDSLSSLRTNSVRHAIDRHTSIAAARSSSAVPTDLNSVMSLAFVRPLALPRVSSNRSPRMPVF